MNSNSLDIKYKFNQILNIKINSSSTWPSPVQRDWELLVFVAAVVGALAFAWTFAAVFFRVRRDPAVGCRSLGLLPFVVLQNEKISKLNLIWIQMFFFLTFNFVSWKFISNYAKLQIGQNRNFKKNVNFFRNLFWKFQKKVNCFSKFI